MEKLYEGACEKVEVQKLVSTHTSGYYLEYSELLQDHFNFSFLYVEKFIQTNS